VLLNSYCWCLAGPAKFSKASQRKNFENHWFRVWMQCDHHVASPALNFCETITAVFYVTFVIVWLFSQSTLHIEALRTLISLWAKQCNKSVFYWNKNKLMTALSRRHFYDNTELQLSKLQTSLRYNKLHFDASNCSRKLIKPMFDQYIDIQEQKQKMFVFFFAAMHCITRIFYLGCLLENSKLHISLCDWSFRSFPDLAYFSTGFAKYGGTSFWY